MPDNGENKKQGTTVLCVLFCFSSMLLSELEIPKNNNF